MNKNIAIVDASRHDEMVPPELSVAGLSVVDRTIRLADISNCDKIFVLTTSSFEERIGDIINENDYDAQISILIVDSTRTADHLEKMSENLEFSDRSDTGVLLLNSRSAYFRELPGKALEETTAGTVQSSTASLSEGENESQFLSFHALDLKSLSQLANKQQADDTPGLVEALEQNETLAIEYSEGKRDWQAYLPDEARAATAAEQIWQDCIKPGDGPVSVHLNRPISLAISRYIAPTNISPNEVSVWNLIAAAICGAFALMGGYLGFLGAGIWYQIRSILDGVDGELSRARYEFSQFGAWLDKFCDDAADFVFCIAIAYTCWATGVGTSYGVPPVFWLWIIGIYLGGKAICTGAFYAIPLFEGELAHPYHSLDWWFEKDSQDEEQTTSDKVFAFFKVVTGNDVFVFIAFMSCVVGIAPIYIAVFAIGEVGVGFGRTYQIWQQYLSEDQKREPLDAPTGAAGE